MDDLVYTSSWTSRITSIMKAMETHFEMTDLGLLHYFLGFEIYETPKGIFFSQQKYAQTILDRFLRVILSSYTDICKVLLMIINY